MGVAAQNRLSRIFGNCITLLNGYSEVSNVSLPCVPDAVCPSTMLCVPVPCSVSQYSTMLCVPVPCCVSQYSTMLCVPVPCCVSQYHAVCPSTMLCVPVPCRVSQYHAVFTGSLQTELVLEAGVMDTMKCL